MGQGVEWTKGRGRGFLILLLKWLLCPVSFDRPICYETEGFAAPAILFKNKTRSQLTLGGLIYCQQVKGTGVHFRSSASPREAEPLLIYAIWLIIH